MATRNFVPRADGEGSIGTAVKAWLAGFFKSLHIGGDVDITGVYKKNGTAVQQIVTTGEVSYPDLFVAEESAGSPTTRIPSFLATIGGESYTIFGYKN